MEEDEKKKIDQLIADGEQPYKIIWSDTPKFELPKPIKAEVSQWADYTPGKPIATNNPVFGMSYYSTFVIGSGGVHPSFSAKHPIKNWGKNPCAEVPMTPKSGTPWWPPTKHGMPADSVYWENTCSCNHPLVKHKGFGGDISHPCILCECTDFSPEEENMKQIDTSKPPLELVPGSVESDWHRHKNHGYDPGGWIYKTAKVDPSTFVDTGVVVYGEAVVHQNCVLYSQVKVYGKAIISEGTVLYNTAKVFGNAKIGSNCFIRNSAKVLGTVGKNCTITGRTIIRASLSIPDNSKVIKTPKDYRTQKARGLEILERNGFEPPKNSIYRIERMGTEAKLQSLIGKFVRPCPVTPRHGFVDSRSVATMEEAVQIVKETKTADRKAELIVMPFIDASHSGVWTEGQLSIGTGHDGATSGKDSIMIPVLGKPEHEKDWTKLLADAGITQSPYLELLWVKDENLSLKYVQLRDGPKLPQSVDFIPTKIEVKQVVKAEGDLLAWETAVKGFKPGTVVWHPRGSLASHYAVHAYLSNIPVIVSREPKVGNTLEPNTTVPEANIEELRKGFMLGCSINGTGTERNKYIQLAHIMLTGCHSVTQWLGTNDLLLGIAMGACYRLILSAAVGEFRHKASSNLKGSTREGIYEKAWNCVLEQEMITKFAESMVSFDKEEWSSSYGGPKWYILSRWAAIVFNSLLDGDIKKALEAFNKGVNSCHNGGWTFNKFLSEHEMTVTSDNPIYALIKIAPLLYDAVNTKEVKEFKFEKYKIEELDPDKYLEERGKAQKSSYNGSISSTKNIAKKCCTKECCLNPMCDDCHPAITSQQTYPSCPHNQEETLHDGAEVMLIDQTVPEGYFPVCKAHINNYIVVGYKLLIPSPESELIVCENKCNCGKHDCLDCYKDGCDCEYKNCHDCTSIHCNDCNSDHDEQHCDTCTDGICDDSSCEMCNPETEEA